MAGGASFEDDDDSGGIISEINVTPLVDIVLVLLIIFMVTARLIVSRAIPGVETPKASSGEEVKSTMALTIDKQRAVYLNGARYADRAAIADVLTRAARDNPEVQVVITADNTIQYGDFVTLVDLVRTAGIKRYALTVTEGSAPLPAPAGTPAPSPRAPTAAPATP